MDRNHTCTFYVWKSHLPRCPRLDKHCCRSLKSTHTHSKDQVASRHNFNTVTAAVPWFNPCLLPHILRIPEENWLFQCFPLTKPYFFCILLPLVKAHWLLLWYSKGWYWAAFARACPPSAHMHSSCAIDWPVRATVGKAADWTTDLWICGENTLPTEPLPSGVETFRFYLRVSAEGAENGKSLGRCPVWLHHFSWQLWYPPDLLSHYRRTAPSRRRTGDIRRSQLWINLHFGPW